MKNGLLGCVFLSLTLLHGCGSDSSDSKFSSEAELGEAFSKFSSEAELGEALFSDVNLSKNRTQSCATCHNPEAGFADDRESDLDPGHAFAASLGDDDVSFGDRNAPTAGYAAFIPEFENRNRDRIVTGFDSYSGYQGGQFWDGREANLTGQAGGPPTNPIEMGMEDKIAVVERLKENSDYINAFERLYDQSIFDDADAAYLAMAQSIAEFEKTDEFSPFDSKYDQSLEIDRETFQNEYQYQGLADLGKTLFFSSDMNCAACHQLENLKNKQEIFSSFEYHNIGVPENTSLKTIRLVASGLETGIDFGLFNNPNVAEEDKESSKGKFKVPTLRNIAVTAPYMHNGIFNELKTVIKFYEHARFRAAEGEDGFPLNPETNLFWGEPEVGENISATELGRIGANTPLNENNVAALECFLLTLTDAKYEHLLDQEKVSECGI